MRKPQAVADSAYSQHTALFLYGLLVVLPALVLGGLLFTQILGYHRQQLEDVPVATREAAARLREAIREELSDIVETETEREFSVYDTDYFEESTLTREGNLEPTSLPSPLRVETTPGICVWFEWNAISAAGPILVSRGPLPSEDRDAWLQRRLSTERFVTEELIDTLKLEPAELRAVGPENAVELPVELVALNLSRVRQESVLEYGLAELRRNLGENRTMPVRISPFELQLFRGKDGELRVVGLRTCETDALTGHDEKSPPDCFEELRRRARLIQGFVIEGDWLLEDLPRHTARSILGAGMRLVLPGESKQLDDPDLATAEFDLFRACDIEVALEQDAEQGVFWVTTSTGELRGALRRQRAWLIGVMAVLTASLVIGIRLLVGSVRASQQQARRTENFVAAVTHELRTPVAAVKMYGEMLRDGWAPTEEKRQEYLDRIVRESDRLDGLVDRLLLKRKLADARAAPTPGDLNTHVSHLVPELRAAGEGAGDDLEFDLAPGLPPVLLQAEAVRDVLVNLVENARKYAPVEPGGEPIRVVTRRDRRGKVVLEVSDRGPGIPEEERIRVFDAFYRIGDERTRRTRGTGLGLHLVALQAAGMRAKAQALPRAGGGATLRVTFKTLRPGTVA